MAALRPLVALCSAVALFGGCADTVQRSVDFADFHNSVKDAIYFDLDEAPAPTAAVVVGSRSLKPELRVMAVPFASSFVSADRQLLNTHGVQGKATIITLVAGPTMPAKSVIRIKPLFEPADETDFSRDDVKGSLLFLSSGLKRRFVYRMPSQEELTSEQWSSLSQVTNASPSHIIIRLPVGSEIFERSKSALQASFEKETQSGRVRGYPYAELSPQAVVDVRYQVPPTHLQKQIFEYSIKAFIALLSPLVALGVLTSDKVRTPRTRKVVLAIGITIQLLVLGGLLWWAFVIQSVVGLSAVLDIGLAVLGAVATVLLAIIRKPS